MTTQRDMLVETFTKLGIHFEQFEWDGSCWVNLSAEDGPLMGGYLGFACLFRFSALGVLEKVLIVE